jgi:hypothetical protein
MQEKLHPKPYKAIKNNRKLTIARMQAQINSKVQSIPIFKEGKLLGYKYIFHTK